MDKINNLIPPLEIIPTQLLEHHKKEIKNLNLKSNCNLLVDAENSTDSFSFYVSASSVFLNKIEGEEIDLDSYIKHKRYGIEFRPEFTKIIDDLY